MYAQAQPDELMYKSITALSHASYGKRFNKPVLLAEAGTRCAETLRMLRNSVGTDMRNLPTRELIISILLMGIYEVGETSSQEMNDN